MSEGGDLNKYKLQAAEVGLELAEGKIAELEGRVEKLEDLMEHFQVQLRRLRSGVW